MFYRLTLKSGTRIDIAGAYVRIPYLDAAELAGFADGDDLFTATIYANDVADPSMLEGGELEGLFPIFFDNVGGMFTSEDAVVSAEDRTWKYIRDELAELKAGDLAELAQAAYKNDEAVKFYENILSNYLDAIQNEEGKPDEDTLSELADGAPDVYNDTRMMECIGTNAYLDVPEHGDGSQDIITLAGYVLYDLANVILHKLDERYDEIVAELEPEAGE